MTAKKRATKAAQSQSNKHNSKQPMPGQHIRVSEAGGCPRRIQNRLMGAEAAPWPEHSQRAFLDGNIHEADILKWGMLNLPDGPYRLFDEQRRVKLFGGKIIGHIDGVYECSGEKMLAEVKFLDRRLISSITDKGVEKGAPQYYTQCQLYMAGLGVDAAWFLARDKSTPRNRMYSHIFERIEYDTDFVADTTKRLVDLLAMTHDGEMLDPPYNPGEDWQCGYCQYKTVCHPDYEFVPKAPANVPDLDGACRQYLDVSEQISELSDIKKDLKGKLMSFGPSVRAKNHLITVKESQQERIDTTKARKILPAAQLSEITKIVPMKRLYVEVVDDG